MNVLHIPALRLGRTYESLDTAEVRDIRTGTVLAVVSQVNAGIIRKDLQRVAASRAALKRFSVSQLLDLSAKAADLFVNASLPIGVQGGTQSPEDYVLTLSATSGLPHVMVRRNLTRIHTALSNLRTVLNGLSRGLDPAVLEKIAASRKSWQLIAGFAIGFGLIALFLLLPVASGGLDVH